MPETQVKLPRLNITFPEGFKKKPMKMFDAWLAELRKPGLVQNHGFLAHVDNKGKILAECCLGVYCRLRGFVAADKEQPKKSQFVSRFYNGSRLTLPPELEKTEGLFPSLDLVGEGNMPIKITPLDKDGKIIDLGFHKRNTAVMLNDNLRLNFEEIAQVLELVFTNAPDDNNRIPEGQDPAPGNVQEAQSKEAQPVVDGTEKSREQTNQ